MWPVIWSLLPKNTVILTRYFVTLWCKSHSIHIQEIYIHINNAKQIRIVWYLTYNYHTAVRRHNTLFCKILKMQFFFVYSNIFVSNILYNPISDAHCSHGQASSQLTDTSMPYECRNLSSSGLSPYSNAMELWYPDYALFCVSTRNL